MQQKSTQFKQNLIHLRSQFMNYTQLHKTKGVPIQHLVILLQKYIPTRPTSLETLISRSIARHHITWEHLLLYLEEEIELEDQVNKIKLSRPSVIDVGFCGDPDARLGQRISEIMHEVKKKSTNRIKIIDKAQFLGFRMLVVALEKEILFYDCEARKIIGNLQFRYLNVRKKVITNFKQKNNDHKFMYQCVVGIIDRHKNTDEENDKVNSMSAMTPDYVYSAGHRSRRNVHADELKNILCNNMRNSKAGSSAGSESNQHQKIGRSVTMMDASSLLAVKNRERSRKVEQGSNYGVSLYKDPKEKMRKETIKIRGNDKTAILKLITESKVEGSIEAIKAYRNSIENFQKYVEVDRNKIEPEKDDSSNKPPHQTSSRFDYKGSINEIKNQGKELQLKRRNMEPRPQGRGPSFIRRTQQTKPKSSSKSKLSKITEKSVKLDRHKTEEKQVPEGDSDQKGIFDNYPNDAFSLLEKKVLEVQCISFYENYMLISLMNGQVRLYSFKRALHGFSEKLIFEKIYRSIVSHVLIYRSHIRKLLNICLFVSKFGPETLANKSISDDIRLTSAANSHNKSKQSEIIVYELSAKMQIQRQAYSSYLSYWPIYINMLPLGIGGFTQSSQFFILQLNCTSKTKPENKRVDSYLQNPDTGKKVSISSMKCHRNLVSIYFGSKDGSIYAYDLLGGAVRNKNKLTSCEILELMFVNQGSEIMFWDGSGKVGICNTDTLVVSYLVSVISGSVREETIGSSRKYEHMVPYFTEGEFLVYGDRALGLISLFENDQKKFNIEKPTKIYNRRQAIKNRRNQLRTQTQSPQPLTPGKKIFRVFHTPGSLITTTSDGQLLAYNAQLCYIGSYFTMSFSTLTQCKCCPAIKYLYLLHQSNDMQVVNLYTQQELINISSVKQQIYDIFFCHSSIYFCGYLTARRYELAIYAHAEQSGGSGSRLPSRTGPVITISLYALIRDISEQGYRQSALSRLSSASIASMQYQVWFYKGGMIIVKHVLAQVLFLYKKTYTRNCVIKCQQYLSTLAEPPQIIASYVDVQSGRLSLMMSTSILMVVDLQTKSVQSVHRVDPPGIEAQREILQYYYSVNTGDVYLLWRLHAGSPGQDITNNYEYCRYERQQGGGGWRPGTIQQMRLRYCVDREPAEGSGDGWSGEPFLVAGSVLTLAQDELGISGYRGRELARVAGQNQDNSWSRRNQGNMNISKKVEFDCFKITPE